MAYPSGSVKVNVRPNGPSNGARRRSGRRRRRGGRARPGRRRRAATAPRRARGAAAAASRSTPGSGSRTANGMGVVSNTTAPGGPAGSAAQPQLGLVEGGRRARGRAPAGRGSRGRSRSWGASGCRLDVRFLTSPMMCQDVDMSQAEVVGPVGGVGGLRPEAGRRRPADRHGRRAAPARPDRPPVRRAWSCSASARACPTPSWPAARSSPGSR